MNNGDIELLPNLEAFDVLSLDVFDTAITRSVESPVDVFAILESNLERVLGRHARGLASLREAAEQEVRVAAHAQGRQEVALREIHARMAAHRPILADHPDLLAAAELEAELSVVMPVEEIRRLADRARSNGRRVVFVSDMYLPSKAIGRLLEACGYQPGGQLLVSSETGCTKATGTQWARLRDLVGRNARIIHLGDDGWSDVDSPRQHGLSSLHFTAAISHRRIGGPLDPPVLPFSRISRARQYPAAAPDASLDPGPGRFMRSFGASWGVIVVGAFLRWLEERVRRQQLSEVAFLARDGWLLHRAWQAAGCAERTGLAGQYLHISRRTLNMAEAGIPDSRGGLSETGLDLIAGGTESLEHLLERAGLLRVDQLVADVKRAFGSLAVRLASEQASAELRGIFRAHEAEVLGALRGKRAETSGYLHQELPASGRVGIVDIGWHGTLQKSLVRLIGDEPRIVGLYLGLWPPAQRRRPMAGWMEAAFASDFTPPAESRGLQNAVAILENLNLASHGTTIGYRFDGGRWSPLHRAAAHEQAQHDALIAPFQEAVLEGVAALFRDGTFAGVPLDDITIAAGRAAIDRVALSPTPEERAVLGSILHARDAAHSEFRPIALPATTAGDVSAPGISEWPVATALNIRDALRNGELSTMREVAEDHLRCLAETLDTRSRRILA